MEKSQRKSIRPSDFYCTKKWCPSVLSDLIYCDDSDEEEQYFSKDLHARTLPPGDEDVVIPQSPVIASADTSDCSGLVSPTPLNVSVIDHLIASTVHSTPVSQDATSASGPNIAPLEPGYTSDDDIPLSSLVPSATCDENVPLSSLMLGDNSDDDVPLSSLMLGDNSDDDIPLSSLIPKMKNSTTASQGTKIISNDKVSPTNSEKRNENISAKKRLSYPLDSQEVPSKKTKTVTEKQTGASKQKTKTLCSRDEPARKIIKQPEASRQKTKTECCHDESQRKNAKRPILGEQENQITDVVHDEKKKRRSKGEREKENRESCTVESNETLEQPKDNRKYVGTLQHLSNVNVIKSKQPRSTVKVAVNVNDPCKVGSLKDNKSCLTQQPKGILKVAVDVKGSSKVVAKPVVEKNVRVSQNKVSQVSKLSDVGKLSKITKDSGKSQNRVQGISNDTADTQPEIVDHDHQKSHSKLQKVDSQQKEVPRVTQSVHIGEERKNFKKCSAKFQKPASVDVKLTKEIAGTVKNSSKDVALVNVEGGVSVSQAEVSGVDLSADSLILDLSLSRALDFSLENVTFDDIPAMDISACSFETFTGMDACADEIVNQEDNLNCFVDENDNEVLPFGSKLLETPKSTENKRKMSAVVSKNVSRKDKKGTHTFQQNTDNNFGGPSSEKSLLTTSPDQTPHSKINSSTASESRYHFRQRTPATQIIDSDCSEDFNEESESDGDSDVEWRVSDPKINTGSGEALVAENEKEGESDGSDEENAFVTLPHRNHAAWEKKLAAPAKIPRKAKGKENNPPSEDINRNHMWEDEDLVEAHRTTRVIPTPSDSLVDPIEYFDYFFDDDIVKLMTDFTNISSAVKKGGDKCLNLTPTEMKKILGLLLLMGVLKLPAFRDYWAADTQVPQVSKVMPFNKFMSIRSNLHFYDKSKEDTLDKTDRFCKVRSLLNHMKDKCNGLQQENDFSIDESMLPYKGTFAGSLRQFIQNKPHRFGIKLFCLAGKSGIVYDFIPYAGASTFDGIDFTDEEVNMGKGAQIVLHLSRMIDDPENAALYFDNYFSSMKLAQYLKDSSKILCVGTVRKNRIDKCPLIEDKILIAAGRGSYDNKSKDGVQVTKWVDNKVVHVVSTLAGVQPVGQVKRYDKQTKNKLDVVIPRCIELYNKGMGGVDLHDMLIELYRTPTRARRWYMTIISYAIDLGVVNSWMLYRRHAQGLGEKPAYDLKHFRLEISKSLRGAGHTKADFGPNVKKVILNPRGLRPAPSSVHDGLHHWPSYSNNKGRCKHCKTGFTFVVCAKCELHLCFVPTRQCFSKFHISDDED